MTAPAGRAFDDGIAMLGLFDVSLTAPTISDKYVSLTEVPRLLALILSKSFGSSVTLATLVLSEAKVPLVNCTEGVATVALP